MNLTIIRELLVLYRNDSSSNLIDETKLLSFCDKIKCTSTTKTARNSPQLAPACWNLLVQINRLPSSTFSGEISFLQTAKVVLSCGKIIESARNELKMGPLDLDKILANLTSKLTEGYKHVIFSKSIETRVSIIDLIEFFFERLQGHLNSLESGIRRMSLIEFSTMDDPFVDVKFHCLSLDAIKDSTIKQLCTIALESLCRLALLFQKGPLDSVLNVLTPFHLDALSSDPETANKYISHFISSISKLEFYCQLEWKFWNHICKFEVYKQFAGYFKRRRHLPLPPPTDSDIPSLDMKIIAAVIESEQLIDLMLQAACSCNEFDDEIVGICLKLLLKEDSQKYLPTIEFILEQAPAQPISDSGLRLLLSALDPLRNGLFHLMRDDNFIGLLAVLDKLLVKINFPVKFYVSWTTCILKFATEQRKLANVPNLIKVSIASLLKLFDEIPKDMKPKVQKIINQTVSISGDCDLLRQCNLKFESSLSIILEASVFNLPQNYFNELCLLFRDESDLLASWIKVLSNQNQVTSKAFQFNNVSHLHSLVKIISKQIFDQFKSSQYLEFIYNRMVELGCDQETIVLSKLLAFPIKRSVFKADLSFSDLSVQSAFYFMKNYKETGQMNFDHLNLSNVKIKSEIELELYHDVLNLIFIHAPRQILLDILDRFDESVNTVNRLRCLETNCHWDQIIQGTELGKLHLLYLKVRVKARSALFIIFRENSLKL